MRPDVAAASVARAMHHMVAPLRVHLAGLDDTEQRHEQQIAELIKANADLRERLATLEARPPILGPPGPPGVDGRDGTLDNLKMLFDGWRTLTFCFKNGDPIEGGTIRVPWVLDCGTYKSSATYEQGDLVTWGGGGWIAQGTTIEKPGDGATAWRLTWKSRRS